MYYYFDPLYYIIFFPILIFSFWAQWRVKYNFEKFSNYNNRFGYTGAQIAEILLAKNGINDVPVEQSSGWLSDHYSPFERKLRLSPAVYNSSSLSAIGVAAHEVGHAIQHYKGYAIMRLWLPLAKPAAISGNIAIWLLMLGFILNLFNLALIGFWIFAAVVAFQIITLPLEFNASARAKELLYSYGIISDRERKGVAAVLNSAALTYIAAAAASLAQLLYYAIRLGLFRSRDD